MTPAEILHDALLSDSLPSHLHGHTPEKTLHARLSEDVARLREGSRFFRTSKARFFLREFIADDQVPAVFKEEYFARPRRKDLQRETVLAFDARRFARTLPRSIISKTQLDSAFFSEAYRYLSWKEAVARDDLLPAHSFVVVHRDLKVLTSHAGKYVLNEAISSDARSIGFGNVVRVQDSDLLYNAYYGVIGSGINELIYSVGLPNELARIARYEARLRLHCALIEEGGDGSRYMRVVLSYRAPASFSASSAGLSLNRLQWVNALHLDGQQPGYDKATETLIQSGWLQRIVRSW